MKTGGFKPAAWIARPAICHNPVCVCVLAGSSSAMLLRTILGAVRGSAGWTAATPLTLCLATVQPVEAELQELA
ncbi:hypothetical protein CHLRE_21g753247v5 [Chlamydomonas reinhardtii]|uniref:Uncharacterized protein n=1 Tax=Chlamydomonas reinhardtii TaxID=3055 RepID=A0A2K3CND0_CHLRE|nr:uncharacterized protein CHLRE_21g753247v5 [Chlamydomonas reinhardtii]PNW69775.1 hypothetical protein CHLRE_21g753247v5 [Chlamydomonas reinhardtii]